ncbi:hypothetical protein [Xanthomonas campestris]|uniref:hypothetical protein n=1 Tax=Xanthomonas campestris TaxID=339 RepID=UPI001F1ECADF|nr:hypothetical protein [Xanthomonas campestris]
MLIWLTASAPSTPLPVSYDHPSGAVTWVNLDDEVVAQLQLGASHLKIPRLGNAVRLLTGKSPPLVKRELSKLFANSRLQPNWSRPPIKVLIEKS